MFNLKKEIPWCRKIKQAWFCSELHSVLRMSQQWNNIIFFSSAPCSCAFSSKMCKKPQI